MRDHTCQRPRTCSCSITADEPNESCPIHGAGEWPPRCQTCGRLMPWPKTVADRVADGPVAFCSALDTGGGTVGGAARHAYYNWAPPEEN